MTDLEKQWLERHGFKINNELSKSIGTPIYVKQPIATEDSLLKIYIEYNINRWIFFLRFPYNNIHIKYSQMFCDLSDSNLNLFITRWNEFEVVDMLKKMNQEYFIPEAMKQAKKEEDKEQP